MKLIIDIDEEQYEFIKQGMPIGKVMQFPALMESICEHIAHGTPLDTVKAEIKTFTITEKSEHDTGFNDGVLKCFNALDNIGKAESEDKE